MILKEMPYYRLCNLTEWRIVKGNPRYAVSCNGEVLNWNWNRTNKPRICSPFDNGKGYLILSINRVPTLVHRLVADAFIPNPQHKPEVDHIDINRQNNCAWNLRWTTAKENQNNPSTIKKMSENGSMLGKFGVEHHSSIPIVQLTLDGQFIRKWSCAAEVKRELGINHGNIISCCKGKLKSAGGYKWMYASEF